jgi:hypothetical protein
MSGDAGPLWYLEIGPGTLRIAQHVADHPVFRKQMMAQWILIDRHAQGVIVAEGIYDDGDDTRRPVYEDIGAAWWMGARVNLVEGGPEPLDPTPIIDFENSEIRWSDPQSGKVKRYHRGAHRTSAAGDQR